MSRTHVRRLGVAGGLQSPARARGVSGDTREETLAFLRGKMALIAGESGSAAACNPGGTSLGTSLAETTTSRDASSWHRAASTAEELGIGGELASWVPLARGEVTEASACEALVTGLITQASLRGLSTAVIGWPALSFAVPGGRGALAGNPRGISSGLECGLSADTAPGKESNLGDGLVIAVPEPPNALRAATILAEGFDLVVCRGAGPLTATRARPLRAKLRAGSAALLAVETTLSSPYARVKARLAAASGLGRGSGRIAGLELEVETALRGHPPRRTTLRLGEGLPGSGWARNAVGGGARHAGGVRSEAESGSEKEGRGLLAV